MVTSFDQTLSVSLGLSVRTIHYGLMLLLAITIVASFESVGVILVIAMLIFPSTTASFFFTRMPAILFSLSTLHFLFIWRFLPRSMAGLLDRRIHGRSRDVLLWIAWLFGTDGILPNLFFRKVSILKIIPSRTGTKKASRLPRGLITKFRGTIIPSFLSFLFPFAKAILEAVLFLQLQPSMLTRAPFCKLSWAINTNHFSFAAYLNFLFLFSLGNCKCF